MRVKTLHGSFVFTVQRLGQGEEATTWLEQSGQVRDGYVSERLAEFSAYYSNRLSYEEVARLLERISGERLLSDQQIRQMVVETAVEISQQWAAEVASALEAEPGLAVAEQVDWYEAQAEEVLVMADAIQVKQQKPTRGEKEAEAVTEPPTVRVNTEVWLVEQSPGEFRCLTAGIDERGAEVVSVEQRVRACLVQAYGGRAEGLPVVAITDGAKTIRCQLETIFGRTVPLILDWYHLEKKVWELLSMIARTKAEKEKHVETVLRSLWRGRVKEALEYLRTEVQPKKAESLAALITYLEKHQAEIIDYQRRQQAGKAIGSGRMEKGVDQVIGARQKHKGMSWSPAGSKALGILKTLELNHQWERFWFPEKATA